MSQSDSSNTWSGSVDSYYSESSSSWKCTAPRRLVALVTEQLRRLKCRNNKRNDEGEVAMYMMNQDPSIEPRQLAGLLKERLELLNAESDEDDQHVTRSPRRVVFLEDKPSCSGTDLSTQFTEIMEVDVTLSSKAILQVPSNSTDAILGDPKECDLGKMILSGQSSIFRVNFPDLEDLENSVTKADVSVIDEIEHEGEAAKKQIRTMSGEVRVYENGRIAIAYGGNVYEMTKSDTPAFDHELIRVDQVEGAQSGIMTSLGPVQHYVDIMPRTEEDICACTMDADEVKAKGEERQYKNPEEIYSEEF